MHKTWHGDRGTAGPQQPPAASSRWPGAWSGAAAGLPSGQRGVPGGPRTGQPLKPWTCPRACTGCGHGSGDMGPGSGGFAVSVASYPPAPLPPFPLPCPLRCWLAGTLPCRWGHHGVGPHGLPGATPAPAFSACLLRAQWEGRGMATAVCPPQPEMGDPLLSPRCGWWAVFGRGWFERVLSYTVRHFFTLLREV